MSSTLMWEPAEGKSLPNELKRVISKRLWGTDGSNGYGHVTMDRCDLEYLGGLRDVGVKGAEELIGYIEKHGSVKLWHQS